MKQGRPDTQAPSASSLLKRWAPLAALVALGLLAWAAGAADLLSFRAVAENRDALTQAVENNRTLAVAVYAVVYAVAVALSLPGGALLTILGGFLFGWLYGGGIAVVAATAGATGVFLIARSSLGETLAERAGPRLEKLRAGFSRDALSYLLFLRLVPAFPFWLVNLAPALLGMRLAPYVVGTFLGIIPGTFAFAFAGAGLDSVIAAQQEAYQACLDSGTGQACEFSLDAGSLLTEEIVIAFVALGIVALLPVVLKRLRRPGP